MNNFGVVIAVILAVGALFIFQNKGIAGVDEARNLLEQGAVVIDVRTPAEYASDNVSIAKNVPLNELRSKIEAVVPDKETPILCHCASGIRSGKATKILKAMGYATVRNLGSLQSAKDAVKE